MYAIVSSEKIQLPAGAVVRLPASWQEYQRLCEHRGDGSIPRIKYRDGEVLLMSPLPVYGRDANLVADIVKALLDHDGREYDAFTPVTMTLLEESGIEPDYCFYIDNWQAVSGKKRIDWQQEPPPDLVIEIDVTSYSDVQDYLPYRVPEVWLFKKQQLLIYQLQVTNYQLQTHSRYFPELDLQTAIAQCVQIAYERNTSAAIRHLRQQLRVDTPPAIKTRYACFDVKPGDSSFTVRTCSSRLSPTRVVVPTPEA
jgi:Uma2 family endonuclease